MNDRRSRQPTLAEANEYQRRRQRRDASDRQLSAQLAPIVAQLCKAPLQRTP